MEENNAEGRDNFRESEDGLETRDEKAREKRARISIWMISTIVIALLLIISVFTNGFGIRGVTGATTVSVEENVRNYIESYLVEPGTEVEVSDFKEENGLYKFTIKIMGREFDSYASKDGKLLFPNVIDMTKEIEISGQQQETVEIPEKDVPEVGLYIFSYCPAGSSVLDSFAPVANLLKERAKLKVRFFSDMHGDYELQQNKIQECIQEIDSSRYWDYANEFYETVYELCASSRDIKCDIEKSVVLMKKKGINSDKVLKCVEEKGDELYSADKKMAEELQLRYSPSFVINDVYVSNIDRSSEGIKEKICSAFKKAPKECSEKLGSSAVVASGSC